jgi:hypothetical protein
MGQRVSSSCWNIEARDSDSAQGGAIKQDCRANSVEFKRFIIELSRHWRLGGRRDVRSAT